MGFVQGQSSKVQLPLIQTPKTISEITLPTTGFQPATFSSLAQCPNPHKTGQSIAASILNYI